MELKNRKYINNTGNLPGFADGKGYNSATSLINSINPWVQLGAWAGGGVAEGLGAKKGTDEILTEGGVTNSSIGGINYQVQKGVDSNQFMKDYDKSTAASFLTNPFKGLTMLFSRGSQKREMEKANQIAMNTTDFNRSSALSDSLQQQYLQKNGSNDNQLLYAAEGKKPVATAQGIKKAKPNAMTAPGEVIVSTKDGSVFENPGYASGKDVIPSIIRDSDAVLSSLHGGAQYFKNTGDLEGALYIDQMGRNMKGYKCGKKPKKHYVDGTFPNIQLTKPKKPSFLNQYDLDFDIPRTAQIATSQKSTESNADFPNKQLTTKLDKPNFLNSYDLNFNLPYMAQTAIPISESLKVGSIMPQITNISRPKGGLYNFWDPVKLKTSNINISTDSRTNDSNNSSKSEFISPWGNFAITTLGSLAGLGQMIDAASQKPYKPNIYVPNKYERSALNTMAGLNVNPYSIMPHLYNNYGRTVGAINTSGGLSAGQRAAARMSAMNTTQQNIANTLQQIQHQNNQYKQGWAQAALTSGLNDAQRMMGANQYNEDYFAKSHAARQQGMQMGIYNLLNQLQQGYANDFKRVMGNNMLNQYMLNRQADQAAIKSLFA